MWAFLILRAKIATYFKLNILAVFARDKVGVLDLVINVTCGLEKSTRQYYLQM